MTADGVELVITREFNAPRGVVFAAWTDPEHLKHWWGPVGFEWLHCSLDLQPGGMFHYCMRGPTGYVMWGKFVYGRIEAPELLEYIVSFSDADGGTLRALFSETWPLEVFNQLSFTEQNGRTLVTMRGWPHNASAEEIETFRGGHGSMQKGFGGTMDQLESYLAGLQGGPDAG